MDASQIRFCWATLGTPVCITTSFLSSPLLPLLSELPSRCSPFLQWPLRFPLSILTLQSWSCMHLFTAHFPASPCLRIKSKIYWPGSVSLWNPWPAFFQGLNYLGSSCVWAFISITLQLPDPCTPPSVKIRTETTEVTNFLSSSLPCWVGGWSHPQPWVLFGTCPVVLGHSTVPGTEMEHRKGSIIWMSADTVFQPDWSETGNGETYLKT